MKKLYTLLFTVILGFAANAQVTITQWNFTGDVLTPSTGAGTMTLLGGVSEGYATGNDIASPTSDRALNTSAYPADGTASGTAGIQVNVNTTNFGGITVTYDRKGSNTASKWEEFQYTINGTTWVTLGNNGGNLTNTGTGVLWPTTTYTLPATADQNANFAFRMVSIFAPTTSAYAPIGAASSYGSGGTWRFDNVTVKGTQLGVNQNSIAGLQVYPNPVTNGNLFITSDNSASKAVAIYDVLGKLVIKTTILDQPVNVSNLKGGVYIVKITEEGKTATRKLVIR
ncbi:MAG TPA: T9SS type A sorting domain-containing protein [Flavobacterium sp.]|nr:T9SS type A sorting domain-containing protein [Flavobacterium sp.]